jgi:hypothetical protein
MDVLLHLIVLCLVFALLYWMIVLVTGLLPAPVATAAKAVLLVLLAFLALGVLLGEVGVWDASWGLWHRHRW